MNSKRLAVKDFQDYANLYVGGKENAIAAREKCGDRWEVEEKIRKRV